MTTATAMPDFQSTLSVLFCHKMEISVFECPYKTETAMSSFSIHPMISVFVRHKKKKRSVCMYVLPPAVAVYSVSPRVLSCQPQKKKTGVACLKVCPGSALCLSALVDVLLYTVQMKSNKAPCLCSSLSAGYLSFSLMWDRPP